MSRHCGSWSESRGTKSSNSPRTGRDREQQRQVVRIGVLVRQILVNALKNRFRLFSVVQVVALAGLRVGFLVEQVGARGEQKEERQAV